MEQYTLKVTAHFIPGEGLKIEARVDTKRESYELEEMDTVRDNQYHPIEAANRIKRMAAELLEEIK